MMLVSLNMRENSGRFTGIIIYSRTLERNEILFTVIVLNIRWYTSRNKVESLSSSTVMSPL